MEFSEQVRSWAEFFSEMPVQGSGEKEKTEKTEKTENSFKNEILHFLHNLHNLQFSTTLTADYLSTRSSLPKRALALYCIYETLTDAELAGHLAVEPKQAADTRKKQNIAGRIESKTEERPAHYGLTAAARVTEEQTLREWLQGRLDALEREERLQKERKAEALQSGREKIAAPGPLRADLAEQFRKGDYAVQIIFADVATHSPDLAQDLLDNPEETIKAAHLALRTHTKKEVSLLVEDLPESAQHSLRVLRTEHLHRLVQVVGEPESISDVRPIVTSARFECPSCGNIIPVAQLGDRFKEPPACGCGRKGGFRLIKRDMVDSATVGLTQPLAEVLSGQGRRTQLRLFLRGVLTIPERMGKVTPGLPLRIVGVLKEQPVPLRNGGHSVRMDYYLDGVSFLPVEDYDITLSFTEQEIASFQAAAAGDRFLQDLAESCFPAHEGDDHIKLAVALQLFRGRFDAREDMESLNALLVGDPGTGKTRNFLRRAVSLSPIGRFAQGTNSTPAGLLGSASTKDQESGRFVYEPGALSRAHRGLIAIDELGAIFPDELKGLNEALEEGCITFDKATLHLRVPADIACLAAGNPKGGRFDDYQDVTAEKLGIEPSTLDRFHLIYLLFDAPDQARDGRIVDRMNSSATGTQTYADEWIRGYIRYARYAVRPSLRTEEKEQLRKFYVGMRGSGQGATLSLGARQYQSLRALTLLSAKARLRSQTRPEDVTVAVQLLEPMLKVFGYDINNLQRWSE